jgi:hypothetical protein
MTNLKCMLSFLAISCLLGDPGFCDKKASKVGGDAKKGSSPTAQLLWSQPRDMASLDLFHGPGGKNHRPHGPFIFLEEDREGSTPKLKIKDSKGVTWIVKLGEEAQPETAATRLLWAVGYFADEVYYLKELRVAGLRKLERGQEFLEDGIVKGARLERFIDGAKKVGNWEWDDNPFVGTKELNGLRVMMALMNNWDLKTDNNTVLEIGGREHRYLVSDLGGTFGKTGSSFTRSKGDMKDNAQSEFIKKASSTKVDFVLKSRPFFMSAVHVPYYVERTAMQKIVQDIPRDHVRWIGKLLARLPTRKIKDAFRAAGYSSSEVDVYAKEVRERIKELTRL